MTAALGIIVAIAGGWNYITILFGGALALGSLLEIHEFRIIAKVSVNRISGKQVFQVQDSTISNSNIFSNVKNVNIYGVHGQKETSTHWRIDRDFVLVSDEYEEFPVELRRGEVLEGEIESNDAINAFLMSRASLNSFRNDYEFRPYWSAEGVTRSNLSYDSPDRRRVYVVVEKNENASEEDETSVSIKLRVLQRQDRQ